MNFKVNLIFLIKPFFLHDQKVVKKTKISWESKELLFKMKQKTIFITFKGLSIKQITQFFFGRWESDSKNWNTESTTSISKSIKYA